MKKRHKAGSVLLIAMTLFASIEGFAANTFTAVSGSDWNTAANWSEGVPDVYRTRFLSGNFSAAIITNMPPPEFAGTVSASCGTLGHVSQVAQPGSVVFLTSPPLGSLLIVR